MYLNVPGQFIGFSFAFVDAHNQGTVIDVFIPDV